MKEFAGKIAVITGSATGIGASFAKEAAKRGMKLALIDIADEKNEQTAAVCRELGSPKAVAIHADVSLYEDVQAAIAKVMEDFGGIDLVLSNAGVCTNGGGIAGEPAQDWNWVIGVNVLGTAYVAHEILPILAKQKTPCHYMVTSSTAGMMASVAEGGAYLASKHAVVSMAEQIRDYSGKCGFDMGVSVFCPNAVKTDIPYSHLVRPAHYVREHDPIYDTPEYDMMNKMFEQYILNLGYNPDGLAVRLFRAIEENQMYIISHPADHDIIKARFRAIEADMVHEQEMFNEMGDLYKTEFSNVMLQNQAG